MCYITPITFPCCRRAYVSVDFLKSHCPRDWPKIKCPPEFCMQNFYEPQHRDTGTCWRCRAIDEGLSEEQIELRRPGIDRATVVAGLDQTTPRQRRRAAEESGRCWFCDSREDCKECRVGISIGGLWGSYGTCWYCGSRENCRPCQLATAEAAKNNEPVGGEPEEHDTELPRKKAKGKGKATEKPVNKHLDLSTRVTRSKKSVPSNSRPRSNTGPCTRSQAQAQDQAHASSSSLSNDKIAWQEPESSFYGTYAEGSTNSNVGIVQYDTSPQQQSSSSSYRADHFTTNQSADELDMNIDPRLLNLQYSTSQHEDLGNLNTSNYDNTTLPNHPGNIIQSNNNNSGLYHYTDQTLAHSALAMPNATSRSAVESTNRIQDMDQNDQIHLDLISALGSALDDSDINEERPTGFLGHDDFSAGGYTYPSP